MLGKSRENIKQRGLADVGLADQGDGYFFVNGLQTNRVVRSNFIDGNFSCLAAAQSNTRSGYLNHDRPAARLGDAESRTRDDAHAGQSAGQGGTAVNRMNDALIPFV